MPSARGLNLSVDSVFSLRVGRLTAADWGTRHDVQAGKPEYDELYTYLPSGTAKAQELYVLPLGDKS